jgi:cysteine synthase A
VSSRPVVLFALEWCEFCWSVRKLFDRIGLEYESVDIDSVAYQQDELGVKIRAVLADLAGSPTIPQVYIAGRHIGGATELFDAVRDGSAQALLRANDIDFTDPGDLDPGSLLPKWIQPRKTA